MLSLRSPLAKVWLIVVLLAVPAAVSTGWGEEAKRETGKETHPPPARREALRYDGKSFDEWAEDLRTELKPERRIEAITALAAFGVNGYGREAASTIVALCKPQDPKATDDDPDTQALLVKAAEALRRIGGAEASPVLVDSVKDLNVAVRRFAVVMLATAFNQVPASATAALVRAALDEDKEVRRGAVIALVKTEGDRSLLQRTLTEVGLTRRFVKSLIGILEGPEDGKYGGLDRLAAATILDGVGPKAKAAVPVLLRLLKEPAPPPTAPREEAGPKAKVAELLRLRKEPDSPPTTPEPLQRGAGEHPLIRQAAAAALGGIGAQPEQVVPALVEALKDEDADMRGVAARSIGLFGAEAKSAVPALLAAFNAPPGRNSGPLPDAPSGATGAEIPQLGDEWPARLAIAWAINKIEGTPRKILPGFVDALKRAKVDARQEVYQALGETKPAEDGDWVPLLIELFKQIASDRAQIAAALGKLGPAAKEALPLLTEALRADDPALRKAATQAINQIDRGEKKGERPEPGVIQPDP
jgi:HEAT repeat protein